ncbi:hypothetical protein B1C78_10755 [Thioalkalivibrio denitrificans]|uniref:Uncharacterized protein n=1 Tax=Thioalkalivibrio denitrificans TaxID=108003 RepID=A0A1V3NEQ7_9GAMM|nr:hypothetical protein B1C78_10755 [Thioalkalivibrio denitrificans]
MEQLQGDRRRLTRPQFRTFVDQAACRSPWSDLLQQIYLGDETFVDHMQTRMNTPDTNLNVPRAQ